MTRKILKLPVLLVAIFVAIMFAFDSVGIGPKYIFSYQLILSLVVFSFGLAIIVTGSHSFRKAKTTVNPMTPEKSTQLVTTGIYTLSRNPMYVGFLAWLVAYTIFIGNVVNLLLLPLYVFLVNKLYIVPEERALEQLFTTAFAEYKNRVRRWV